MMLVDLAVVLGGWLLAGFKLLELLLIVLFGSV